MRPLMALIVSFLALAMSFSLSARADHVRNGGGSGERNFAFALTSLDSYIALALADSSSRFTPEERALLIAIQGVLPSEIANPDLLQFRSEAESPGFFMLDGAVRVAKTGDTVGSEIYVNRDLLYSFRDGKWSAIRIPECVAILIHELGHHQGESSHTLLDLLGAKVQTLLEQRITIDEFDPTLSVAGDDLSGIKQFPTLTSVDLSPDTSKAFNSRLYLSDSYGTYDVTANILNGIRYNGDLEGRGADRLAGQSCWGSDFNTSERRGWRLHQFHLSSPRWSYATTIKPGAYLFLLKAALSVQCVNRNDERAVDPGLDALYVVVVETSGVMTKIRALDVFELQKTMMLIHDDDDYKVAAFMRRVFALLEK